MARKPLYMVVNAQPHYAPADVPGYAGTLMGQRERLALGHQVAQGILGKRPLVATIDHAGLRDPRALVPHDKRIGQATDAWTDDDGNLMMIVAVHGDRAEANLLEASMKDGKPWGVSIQNRLIVDAKTKRVLKIDPTHIGATLVPELKNVGKGSMVEYYTRDEDALREKLKTDFFPRAAKPVGDEDLQAIREFGFPHAKGRIPPETVERWSASHSGSPPLMEVTASASAQGETLAEEPLGSLSFVPMSAETPAAAPVVPVATPAPAPAPSTPAPTPVPVQTSPPVQAIAPLTPASHDPNYYAFLGKVTTAERASDIDKIEQYRALCEEAEGLIKPRDFKDKHVVAQKYESMAAAVEAHDARVKRGLGIMAPKLAPDHAAALEALTKRAHQARMEPDPEMRERAKNVRLTYELMAKAAADTADATDRQLAVEAKLLEEQKKVADAQASMSRMEARMAQLEANKGPDAELASLKRQNRELAETIAHPAAAAPVDRMETDESLASAARGGTASAAELERQKQFAERYGTFAVGLTEALRDRVAGSLRDRLPSHIADHQPILGFDPKTGNPVRSRDNHIPVAYTSMGFKVSTGQGGQYAEKKPQGRDVDDIADW